MLIDIHLSFPGRIKVNTMNNQYILFVLFFIHNNSYAEIYKWVDENGSTHFSEKKPENRESEETSAQLKDRINIFESEEIPEFDFYKSPERNKSTKVDIKIELVDYQLTPELRNIIQHRVKIIYRAYVQWFGWNPQPSRPIKIKIFGNYIDFEKYQIEKREGHVTNRSHYSPSRKEVVMLGTEFTDATLSVLFHECSHAIFHMEVAHGPKWINEGLAEVFESSKAQRDKVKVGYDKEWTEIIKHKLREGSLLSFKEYLNISSNGWREESARVERSYYTVAWSMMRFLVSSEQGIAALKNDINDIKLRKNPPWWQKDRLVEIFAEHYPGGIDKLDADWRNWISKLN